VQIGDHQSFMDSGIIDSTGVLELVTFVETNYSIQVRAEELVPDNFDSISRVTEFVAKKLGERCAANA
jgi:acyl carrier protein